MAKKTKFFRVGVEGVTTDGREVSRDWLQQMEATYDRATYGARVFAEHIRGMVPDGPFRALGDVLALKTETIGDGKLKGKLALLAQIEPSEAMVKLVNSGQKIFSSMEIDHDFAKSGSAYLVGLGITDSPASLGTEVLAFAAQHPDASPFMGRKVRPENLFSAAAETAIELEDEPTAADPAAGFFAKLNELLEKFTGKTKPAEGQQVKGELQVSVDVSNADLLSGVGDALHEFATGINASLEAFRADLATQKTATDAQLAKFAEALDTTPASGARRPAATGGNGVVATDC